MKALEIRELGHTYNDGTAGLRGVTLSVEKGESMAILGPNGAGKTTLLKHLNALLLPTSGSVIVGGRESNKKNAANIRKKVGFLFQNPDDQVFSPTVLEDVMFGPINMGHAREEAKTMALDCLDSLGIVELAERHPAHLSYGQKKKVALAGIIVMEPEILVMDEPLAGLDYSGQKGVKELIRELNDEKGITVIFSTHLTERAAELSEHCAILNSGSLLTSGKTRELLTDPEILKRAKLEPPVVTSLLLPLHPEKIPVTPEEGAKLLADILRKRTNGTEKKSGRD